MTPRRFASAPARLVVWALAWQGVFAALACDRQDEARSPALPASTQPVAPPSSQASPADGQSEEFLVKLAALRRLIAEQPRAADRRAYAAYLIRDAAAAELAKALSAAPDGGPLPYDGPPVAASIDSYKRKGRTIDAATGKPVKVFQVVLAGPIGRGSTSRESTARDSSARKSAAEAVASWQAGKLAGASVRYRLRKEAGRWVISGRADENPSDPLP
jgi:hypothetical protein